MRSVPSPWNRPVVRAGFIPLTDCAPLVIARELEFDCENGFELKLHREASWANIRDKVEIGAFDCAHMLAPMPIATALGAGRAVKPVIAPMSLNLGGNAITVSMQVFDEMMSLDPDRAVAGGMGAAHALATVVRQRQAGGREPLTLGMVFPLSCHNYDLRFWLASAGIDPEDDVNIVVVPPPLVNDSLAAGRIDGFCVGAPWSSVAVASGLGRTIATKSELWRLAPEKVLGVRASWARDNPDVLSALIRALVMAARWLDDPANWEQGSEILARPGYIGVPKQAVWRALSGRILRSVGQEDMLDPEFLVFHHNAANFPWRSHAVWIMTQMIRWGQVRHAFDLRTIADRVYRPDLYRTAVAGLGIEVPDTDYKVEGQVPSATGPTPARIGDGHFFAGAVFDPHSIMPYLESFKVRDKAVDFEAFGAINP